MVNEAGTPAEPAGRLEVPEYNWPESDATIPWLFRRERKWVILYPERMLARFKAQGWTAFLCTSMNRGKPDEFQSENELFLGSDKAIYEAVPIRVEGPYDCDGIFQPEYLDGSVFRTADAAKALIAHWATETLRGSLPLHMWVAHEIDGPIAFPEWAAEEERLKKGLPKEKK